MESLALVASVIVVAIVLISVVCVVAGLNRWRLAGVSLGLVGVASGWWFAATLPHAPWLGLMASACGVFAICRGVIAITDGR